MLELRFDNVMAPVIDGGLTETDLMEGRVAAHDAIRRLGTPGFSQLDPLRDVAKRIKTFAGKCRRFKNVVQIGIGGSALGASAIATALKHRWHNEVDGPRFYVLDNVDPEETAALFEMIDPKQTIFHVVTKSGETTETLASFLIALERVRRKVKRGWEKHFVVTTDPEKGYLRKWAGGNVATFEVPPAMGGRFSVLSPVGLVPAALLRIDPVALLDGAIAAQQDLGIASTLAALSWLLDGRRGKHIHVMMPYARALKDLADWWRQLWAESLGKNLATGPTPVPALGATDQHSQVQLYTEGPNDKFFLIVQVKGFRKNVRIPAALKDPSLDFLPGWTIGDILEAERKGTESALVGAGRPTAVLALDEISAKTVGAFFQTFEWATAIAGQLYGVNAFDQPGVEAGKRAAFALLDRPGFEARKAEVLERVQANGKHLVRI